MSTKPTYTKEFQENAVRLALTGERSRSAVARELGIPEWKLRGWVRAHLRAADKDGTRAGIDEIIALQKKLKKLEQENDILKKAAAYFAKTLV
jgi:transposase